MERSRGVALIQLKLVMHEPPEHDVETVDVVDIWKGARLVCSFVLAGRAVFLSLVVIADCSLAGTRLAHHCVGG